MQDLAVSTGRNVRIMFLFVYNDLTVSMSLLYLQRKEAIFQMHATYMCTSKKAMLLVLSVAVPGEGEERGFQFVVIYYCTTRCY